MHSIWLIARREYLERVRTKAFLFSLILFPLIMGGIVALPEFLAGHVAGHKTIAIATADPLLGQMFAQELQSEDNGIKFNLSIVPPTPAAIAQLTRQVRQRELNGFLWLQKSNGATQARFYAGSASDAELASTLEDALQHAQARELLMARGMSQQEIQALFGPVHVDTHRIRSAHNSSTTGNSTSSTILMFMLTASVLGQGFAVSRSVIEEKASRVFEVMLASVTPDQMLGGKLIGVGAVGLTQIAIWMTAAELLSRPGIASASAASSSQISLHLSAWNLVAFLVCFLLGFSFYSALSAMLGSMVNSDQELQQLSLFITLPLFLCFILFQPVIADPSGALAVTLSLLPPFAPLLMYLRIALQTPPIWQIALSFVLMVAGLWTVIWITSRIYRVGVLMYGKRPTLPELLRWLKYS